MAGQSAEERAAQARLDADAESKRERDNAAIRATGERLRAERPDRLDRAMVSAGLDRLRTMVMSCPAHAGDRVTVAVTVDPDGVASTTLVTEVDPVLASCVTAVLDGAHFAPTRRGGSFRYPFSW